MKPKHNKKYLRLLMPLSAMSLLIQTAFTVQAETVTFRPDSWTCFLQNEQLNQGWAIHEGIFSVNGEAAYCIEPKETVAIGEDLYETSSWEAYSGYSQELKNTILELTYFGYGYGGRTDSEYWYATQILIWEAINPAFAATRVYHDEAYSGNQRMSLQAYEITDSVNQKKQEILDTINVYHAGINPRVTDGSGNTLSLPAEVRAGEKVIFTDDSLSRWHPVNEDPCITQQGNTIEVFCRKAGTATLNLQFEGTADTIESAPLVLKARDGSKLQTLIIRGTADPITIPLQVNVRDVSMKIHKSDAERPVRNAGETTLAGARYELFNVTENTVCGTFVTDENGDSQTIGGLNLSDTYRLRETEAPKGFVKDESAPEFTLSQLENNGDLFVKEVSDRSIKGRIAIHKVITSRSTSGPLRDESKAEFTVLPLAFSEKYPSVQEALAHTDELLECEYDIITTDENGKAETHDLVYGTYMVIQTAAMNSDLEFCRPFKAVIDGSAVSPQLFELSNLQNEYELKIVKKDAASGKRITAAAAVFQVFDSEGKPVTQKIGSVTYDTFMTSADQKPAEIGRNIWYDRNGEKGTAVLPLKLPCGTYTVKEVSAPYGYTASEEPLTIEITADGAKADSTGTVTAVIENSRRSGSLTIHKTVAKSDADISLISRENLSGYTFELSAKEDILSPDDGSVIAAAGTKIQEITTGETGTAVLNDLPYGTYQLRETGTVSGVRLNRTPVTLMISEESEELEYEAENEPVLTVFSKQKASDSEELPGAHLSVSKEDGTLVDEWISGDTPHIIEGLDPHMTYILTEELTPRDENGNDAGYVRSEEIRFVPSGEEKQTEVIMKDQVVMVEKTDEKGEPLAGAFLQVVNQNNEVVDSWVSDGTPHAVRGLSQSDLCILQELKAPDGYYRSDDIQFTVSDDGRDQKIVMRDSLIRVRIRKIDEESKQDLAGMTLSLYEIDGETETLAASWLTEGKPIEYDGKLKAGMMYRLEETEWAEGYHRAADIYFTVDEIDPLAEEPLTIIMSDTPVETGAAKTDGQGNYLAGASLRIKDEAGNVLHEWISTSEGPEELSPYVAGGRTYILEETEAPEGYALMEPIRFTVSGNGERHQLIHAVNRPVRIRLEIFKTDAEDSQPLAGAVFQVYRNLDGKKAVDAGGKNAKVTTDEEGKATLILPYEKSGYYVLETKAPSGYRLNRSKFEVQADLKPGVPVVSAKVEVSNEKKTIETGIGGSRGRLLILVSGVLMCVFLVSSKRSSS